MLIYLILRIRICGRCIIPFYRCRNCGTKNTGNNWQSQDSNTGTEESESVS